MEIAALVLEYLKVLLAWPVAAAVVLVWLLITQRHPITRLIDRIKHLDVPGLGKVDTPYPLPEVIPPVEVPEPKKAEASQTPQKDQVELTKRLYSLERDFNTIVYTGLQVNKSTIEMLISKIWNKLLMGVFDPQPRTTHAMMEGLKGRIDKRALVDFEVIENAVSKIKQLPREEIVNAYIRSQRLIGYLRKISG